MFIKSLQLKNFRNYDAASVTFGQGINVLSGENASGKTNLLEAIYLLGLGKSPPYEPRKGAYFVQRRARVYQGGNRKKISHARHRNRN